MDIWGFYVPIEIIWIINGILLVVFILMPPKSPKE